MGIVVIKISFAVRVKERRKQNEYDRLGKKEKLKSLVQGMDVEEV